MSSSMATCCGLVWTALASIPVRPNFHESYHVHGQDIRVIYASARSTFPLPIEDADPRLLDIISSAKIRSYRDYARAQSYLHFWIDVASIKLALLWGTLRRYLYFPSDSHREEDWWRLTRVPTDRLRAFKSAYVPASSPADFCAVALSLEEFSPIFPDKFRGMLGFPEASPPQTLHTPVMVLAAVVETVVRCIIPRLTKVTPIL